MQLDPATSTSVKILYEVCVWGANLAPILLGAFMLYSACFRRSWGKGKRYPVTWYMRLFAGGMGFLFLFLGIRNILESVGKAKAGKGEHRVPPGVYIEFLDDPGGRESTSET